MSKHLQTSAFSAITIFPERSIILLAERNSAHQHAGQPERMCNMPTAPVARGGGTAAPVSKDTDGGGVSDMAESARGTDPLDPKDDKTNPAATAKKDSLSLSEKAQSLIGQTAEVKKKSGPNADSDGGGVTDTAEILRGTNPNDRSDDKRVVTGSDKKKGKDILELSKQARDLLGQLSKALSDPKTV
jgi:hypothetical protein